MTTIAKDQFRGGSGVAEDSDIAIAGLAAALRGVVDDLTEFRTQFIALLVKIDADSGDTGGDADYASTLTPAALTTIKG